MMVSIVAKGGGAERRGIEPKSASVKANHKLLVWSGVLGGAMGFAIAMSVLSTRPEEGNIAEAMIYGPLPVWLAVAMALLWGVVLPVISWRWEQVVDEHEREAYRDGAVAGFYVMGVGAPVWWLLARAGLVPPVEVSILYAAFLTVTGAVWLWRKYR
jgi:hypothetical protein